MMALEDVGGSKCEARLPRWGISKPGSISPTPPSQQGHRFTESNRRERRNATGAKNPSLLAGLLLNGAGERFTPSHAVKRGRR